MSTYNLHKLKKIVHQLRLKFGVWIIKRTYETRKEGIKLLIGDDLKVISNIKITSDIIDYNSLYADNCMLLNVKTKYVSDRQSFVFNPNKPKEVY